MTTAPRHARVAVAIAALSLTAVGLAYVLVPISGFARQLAADVSLTWSSAYAAWCCWGAARRVSSASARRTWRWMAAGCAVWLLGQLAWDYSELVRGHTPSYPSLADVGFLGIYLCFVGAVANLVRSQPQRPAAPELSLDLLLVGFTTAAVAYQFLLSRLDASGASTAAIITSVGWSASGITVLWLILREMLRRSPFPLATAGPVSLGLGIFSLTNIVYGVFALQQRFPAGSLLDLGWVGGFLVIAVAAALAPNVESLGVPAPADDPTAGRAIALVVGLFGLTAVAVAGALGSTPSTATAILVATGGMIAAIRFFYALRVDRRYAARLESDVSERTRSLRALMEAVPDSIVVVDATGRILDTNLRSRMDAAVVGELVGRSVFEVVPDDLAAGLRGHLEAALAGSVVHFELPYTFADGNSRVYSVVLAPVQEDGARPRVVALARDVSDQRRTESQLQQAEKLAAMGQLVSGVAHEINNPAAIISGFAQTMLRDSLAPEHREMARMMYDEATRIGRITQNLLAFARGGGRDRATVDVNDLMRRTVSLRAYHLTTRNIAVALELDPAAPRVWANASQIQQTLLNLIINAEQALEGRPEPRRVTCRTHQGLEEVRLDIEDNGPGIPGATRERIFDPFFTTKAEGVGTGLGLSICYGIVSEHGGRIWAQPSRAGGAAFCIALPRDPRATLPTAAAPPAPVAVVPPSDLTGLRILLAEDEESLRRAVTAFLARDGIAVRAVADGAAALAALSEASYDVIISDVRMPGVGGREFITRLGRDRPELLTRLIFLTGDTLAPDTALLLRDVGAPALAKPFEFAALEHLIREIAARHPTPRGSA